MAAEATMSIVAPRPPRRSPQATIVALAGIGLAAVAFAAHDAGGARGGTLALAAFLGALGGLTLYHAAFGFTAGWRRLVRERRSAGFRAQLLMLAIIVVVAYPFIASGATGAWVFPLGLAAMIGAAMFGFGMQLGGGCGSGVLFTVGGGSTRMVITLAAFVAGSLLWTGTGHLWSGLPRIGGVSVIREAGAPMALLLTLAVLGFLAWLTLRLERRAHGEALPVFARGGDQPFAQRLWSGPWPLWFGALLLAVVVLGCFLVLGRPWGITSAFPLWGAKIADGLGAPIREWDAWRGDRVDRSLFADATGVMNFGVMLGALAAAGLAGRFAPKVGLTARDIATAVIGGLLMGYGARLAYGCNIGGFIGGIASGSLHGWSWLVFGFLGSWAGVHARAWLGMDPPLDPPLDPPQATPQAPPTPGAV